MQRLTAPHYYGALCLLVDEAGFLVESKTAALIGELPANEAKLVAAESIVRALGVTDGPGFDAFMDALTAVGGDGSINGNTTGGGWVFFCGVCQSVSAQQGIYAVGSGSRLRMGV